MVKTTLCAVVLLLSAHARADTRVGLTAGGPPLLSVNKSPTRYTTMPVVMTFSVAFRNDTFTGVGLEAAATSGSVGGALLWDWVRMKDLTLYARLGLTLGPKITVAQIDRSYDILVGAGMDYRLKKNLFLLIDYRVFLPEPSIGLTRGEYVKPAYEEAINGGMLCGGFSLQF